MVTSLSDGENISSNWEKKKKKKKKAQLKRMARRKESGGEACMVVCHILCLNTDTSS